MAPSETMAVNENEEEMPMLGIRGATVQVGFVQRIAAVATCCLTIAALAVLAGGPKQPAANSIHSNRKFIADFPVGQNPTSNQGGGFVSNAQPKTFAWSAPTTTVAAAAEAAFPGGVGWTDITFTEGSGQALTLQGVISWVENVLLNGPDPFVAGGGEVPVPYTAPPAQGGKFSTPRDQLEPGQWVGYSRRQVCFIVAKSLIGSKTIGYDNGLVRFMHKPVGGPTGCTPAAGDFGRAWWGLLAACAVDPTLASGAQGPLLLAAKAMEEPSMEEVRAAGDAASLMSASLRVCFYDDGEADPNLLANMRVPQAACRQPTTGMPGADFMSGGLPGQATQDISASFLGGYIYGNVCDLGGGQDERLMVYYPEVSALTFFLSEAGPDGVYGPPQLRQPAWILGARRLRIGIDGTCRHEHVFELDPNVPMTSDLVDVQVQGTSFKISGSKPFLAFMSENQGFLGWPENAAALGLARRNKEPRQRDVDPASKHSFEKQVRAWYRAVALTSYAAEMQPVLKAVVSSVGVGPWGAGLWWGDSQLGFLASWIGHAIAAMTWGQSLPLDYYLYSAFTENPGNQCMVHSSANCQACMQHCTTSAAGNDHAFWLPGTAFRQPGNSDPCATTSADCGQAGLEEVVQAFAQQKASSLWDTVEAALRNAQGTPISSTVFDLLFPGGAMAGR
mmetsp:Transcript_120798/g.313649  ORF Transcript_120798/g.313649 Transcript_120798/m.313649 type:complete len:675 (+) Transcript_120798:49-2073(+)